MEEIALMTLPRDHLGDLEDKSASSREAYLGTSQLHADKAFTQNNSLFGLTRARSSRERDTARPLNPKAPDLQPSPHPPYVSPLLKVLIPDC